MMAAAVGVIVLTLRLPLTIDTVVPLSETILSPMAEPEINLDSLPIVLLPGVVVTPPPRPAQLPAVVHTS
jgi:hypothetical protein